MTSLDYVLAAVIAVSALIGILRGLIKEVLSLLVWAGALWAAVAYGALGAAWLEPWLADADVRLWAGRVLVFVVLMFAGSLASFALGYLARRLPITTTDRALGLCFGVLRGVLLVMLLVLVLRGGGFDRESWWRQSKLLPYVATATAVLERVATRPLRWAGFQPTPVA